MGVFNVKKITRNAFKISRSSYHKLNCHKMFLIVLCVTVQCSSSQKNSIPNQHLLTRISYDIHKVEYFHFLPEHSFSWMNNDIKVYRSTKDTYNFTTTLMWNQEETPYLARLHPHGTWGVIAHFENGAFVERDNDSREFIPSKFAKNYTGYIHNISREICMLYKWEKLDNYYFGYQKNCTELLFDGLKFWKFGGCNESNDQINENLVCEKNSPLTALSGFSSEPSSNIKKNVTDEKLNHGLDCIHWIIIGSVLGFLSISAILGFVIYKKHKNKMPTGW